MKINEKAVLIGKHTLVEFSVYHVAVFTYTRDLTPGDFATEADEMEAAQFIDGTDIYSYDEFYEQIRPLVACFVDCRYRSPARKGNRDD